MSKIIIHNLSKVKTDAEALEMVSQVVADGRVSANGKSYCYLTVFTRHDGNFGVSAILNKSGSDTFKVWDYGKKSTD